jgi:hypothetical protein
VQVFGSYSFSSGAIFFTRNFTADDGDEATITFARHFAGGTPGATYQYWFKLILTASNGAIRSWVGPKFKWLPKWRG